MDLQDGFITKTYLCCGCLIAQSKKNRGKELTEKSSTIIWSNYLRTIVGNIKTTPEKLKAFYFLFFDHVIINSQIYDINWSVRASGSKSNPDIEIFH